VSNLCFRTASHFEYAPFRVTYHVFLCTNMTSSTKAEVPNISQRYQKRSEPPQLVTRKLVKYGRTVRRFQRYACGHADRQALHVNIRSSISNVVRKLGAPCIKTDCSSWTISATTTITKHSRSYPRPYLPLRSSWRRHRSCEAAFQSSFSPWIPPTRRATCCHCTTRPLRNCWTCEHAALSSTSVVQPRRAHRRLV